MTKIVSLRGNMIDKGFFGTEKVYTVLNLDLLSYAIIIEHGINSKLTKRRFNVKEIEQIVTSNIECGKEDFKNI